MQLWWFKRKLSQTKAFLEYIKLAPDLKLRTFVIVLSLCFGISSFFLGLIIGRNIEAKKAIEVSYAKKHIDYDKRVLNAASLGASELYATKEEDKKFVASLGGKVYYHSSCKGYKRIKEENRVWFKTKGDAEVSGYSLAKNCKY